MDCCRASSWQLMRVRYLLPLCDLFKCYSLKFYNASAVEHACIIFYLYAFFTSQMKTSFVHFSGLLFRRACMRTSCIGCIAQSTETKSKLAVNRRDELAHTTNDLATDERVEYVRSFVWLASSLCSILQNYAVLLSSMQ